jgi:hypothetical protein
MTLQAEPQDSPATLLPPRARALATHREPRAAVFVLGLAAASPSDARGCLRAFAERLMARRARQW